MLRRRPCSGVSGLTGECLSTTFSLRTEAGNPKETVIPTERSGAALAYRNAPSHFRSTYGRVHFLRSAFVPRGGGASLSYRGGVPEYVTIPDVELLTVGMNWPASTGDVTFRFEHLRDAMVAANEDPHTVPPRLKIGHVDPRFADANDPGHNPFYDGEPAFGSVRNLRLVNDGAVLIGDYEDVPAWLAEALASAYPSRSIEGAQSTGVQAAPEGRWQVETPGGKTYSFVLTACALLGMARPAVQDLEDLRRFLVAGEGLVVTAGTAPDGGEPVAATIPDVPRIPKGTSQPADCTASVDKVIESYIFSELPESPAEPEYWWWIRDVITEPNVLIVDNDEGDLLQVEFSSDDAQNVTFGEPERVLQTFVKAPAAAMRAAAAALAPEGSRVLASFATRDESPAAERKGAAPEGGDNGPGKTSGMAPDGKALRVALGLAADASDADLAKALASQAASMETPADPPAGDPPPADPPAGDPPPADPPAGDPPADPPATPPADPPADPPAEAADTVSVPREVWETVQHGAKAGADLAVTAEEERRDGTIEAAKLAGKISPAQDQSMLNLHERDPKGFYVLLTAPVAEGGLQEGIVPTTQAGHAKQSPGAAASAEVSPDEMQTLGFPNGPRPIQTGAEAD